MEKVSLTINGKKIVTEKGKKILWAALENDIFIPHLCAIEDTVSPFGGCRLCFVEIEGRKDPVTSCTEPVAEGLVVETRTEPVLRLVRMAFELILSRHPIICKECPANKQCALQDISREMGFRLKLKRLPQLLPELPVDDSHPLFTYNPNLCVLCGRCVHICNGVEKKAVLDFNFRGFNTQVATFKGRPLEDSSCDSCLECVDACPVGALSKK
ncbi:MAG: 2Fe-2S iron-sulfur cluster-binding protein [Thermodesulfobacteriota bacterium]|nr:2Fe-2S iron-sulfur cluster-binding protein [Thermodesulfobacteriota bacterium]